MNKTLIGKQNYLFLCNDNNEELKIHCENLLKIHDLSLSKYTFKNYIIFVYPNKSLIYKNYLPDEYKIKYRPALEIYKKKFNNNLYDLHDILKNHNNIYYKTDTHINIKGNYIVYKYYIKIINQILDLRIKPIELILYEKECELNTLPYGIGDLTWKSNLGEQILSDIKDNFYYNDEITWFYCKYIIRDDNNIKFLNYNLNDNTNNLKGTIVYWDVISKYIINVKNQDKIPMKIIIFYDSFLLNILPLYFYIFNEIYFIKSTYSNDLINLIEPDYVFEFRVERFLN